MAQYIDKDALVAEMDRLRRVRPSDSLQPTEENKLDWLAGKAFCIASLKVFLDILESKEVDLEKIISDWLFEGLPNDDELIDYIKETAKHFFELGLRSTITEEDCKLIWNIGDDIPYMPEEEFFKEVLKQFKERKKNNYD